MEDKDQISLWFYKIKPFKCLAFISKSELPFIQEITWNVSEYTQTSKIQFPFNMWQKGEEAKIKCYTESIHSVLPKKIGFLITCVIWFKEHCVAYVYEMSA